MEYICRKCRSVVTLEYIVMVWMNLMSWTCVIADSLQGPQVHACTSSLHHTSRCHQPELCETHQLYSNRRLAVYILCQLRRNTFTIHIVLSAPHVA